MTKKGSIKETGEEVSDEKWQRFESAVGVGGNKKESREVQTDQPYREEAEHPESSGSGEPRPDEAEGRSGNELAGKMTKRTE